LRRPPTPTLFPYTTLFRSMEAANRGAFEVGAHSIGLNITLPHEQAPNPYMCPDLAFRFHYFALRKMHFLLHAKGLVAFPGGYGTDRKSTRLNSSHVKISYA